jgi:chemotaxis protein histidine kinase CheA
MADDSGLDAGYDLVPSPLTMPPPAAEYHGQAPASSLGMDSIASLETDNGGSIGTAQGHDNLIEALSQRQQVFSQLGSFVTAMQNETGSVEVWRTKLKELESLRADRRKLKHELAEKERALAKTTAACTKAQDAAKGLRKERDAERAAAAKANESRTQTEKEARQWRERAETLEVDTERLSGEAKVATMLAETNQELNTSLGRAQQELEQQRRSSQEVSVFLLVVSFLFLLNYLFRMCLVVSQRLSPVLLGPIFCGLY